MASVSSYFSFSPRQLRFVSILAATAVVMGGYLLIRNYAQPGPDPLALGVYIGDRQEQFTGVFIIDPNTSPVDSLELLPGIGPVLAERIVEHRQRAPFEREIDITDVPGIGPKLYERIKPYLKVRRY
jgi:DNA uptake protein ComE-like DNA-binding protein